MSSLSKIIAGVLLAAGLVLAFVAWRLASAPSSPPQPVTPVAASAPAPQEPVKFYPVVVAAKAIPAGTRIAPDMLEVAKWQVALSGGFPAADLLAGAIVRTDVAVGDPLLPSMLAHGMASLLQPGERALAVAVDEVSGGGNRILPGDFVDVFFMLDKSSEVQAGQARLLQSQLRVLAYGANSLDGPEEKSLLQQGAPAQPAKTAVLAVPVERVSELMLASRAGRLQLALRPLGDAGVPDIALFPQRRAAMQARADLTPGQRELLDSGPNRAYGGDTLLQMDGTTLSPRQAARGSGGGGRSVEIVRRQIRTRALLNPAAAGSPVYRPQRPQP